MEGQEVRAEALTLAQYLTRVSKAVNAEPELRGQWVSAELSDVNIRGGHCYMELLQKEADTGNLLARVRANCWADTFQRLKKKFEGQTGQPFASGIKVLLCVSTTVHVTFGMSLNISDIDPSYTLGDLQLRRRRIIEQLTREGLIELNRSLNWPLHTWRIAVISGGEAAGMGDFKRQITEHGRPFRFRIKTFPAIVQGEKAPASIIEALKRIERERDQWDGVALIRGGGATSDLGCFEDYNLAAAIAQFPLPVIVGIGHDRDHTLLDWVAKTSVLTPTAVAQWFITRSTKCLDHLNKLGKETVAMVNERLMGERMRISHLEASIPLLPRRIVERNSGRLDRCAERLGHVSARIGIERMRLDSIARSFRPALTTIIERRRGNLKALELLVEALSPQAILKRGYSITRSEGRVVTDTASLKPGAVIKTILAKGTISSTITETDRTDENT